MTKALFHLRQFRLLLIVLLCALCSLPLSASEEAYVVSYDNSKTLYFCYDGSRAWRTGKTWSVDQAHKYTSLGERIERVEFNDSFKNYRPISIARWLEGFTNLTTIKGLENLNTSKVEDMSYMFSGCRSLTSLDLSNFNTSAVTDMSAMFYGCRSLTSLDLSNFNTSKVTDMSQMFNGCRSLRSLNLSNFNTSKVTNMVWMFEYCRSLRTILNPNTWRCEDSQSMFYGCTSLIGAVAFDDKKLDVTMANPTTGYFTDPNREYPKAYVLQSEDQHTITFYYDNNRKLRSGKTWDIDEKSSSSKPVWAGTDKSPNNVVTKVVFDASFKNFRPTTTNFWFYYLKALTTIEGLENLNTSAVTNMRCMFEGCSRLTSLNLSNFNTSAVTDMSWMFYGCSSLTSLNLSNFNTSKVTNMGAMFYGCSSLTSLNLSNFNTGAVTYMGAMFSGCSGLKELNVSNFHTGAVTYMGAMFSGCSGLKELNVSNFNTSNVTDMREMFQWCSSLTSLDIFKFNVSAVTNMSAMFSGCSGLKYLSLFANTNTSAVTDMSWMFYGCSGLKELNVSNFNTSSVTNMSLMFSGCSGLKELNVSNFNTSAVWDMRAMFSGCSGLKELNVSNFNTSAVKNMSEMFSGCSGLKRIFNTKTWGCEKSQDMFKGCIQLKGAVEYDESKVDATMASPVTGYFRDPNKYYTEAYVLLSTDQKTLVFRYDGSRAWRTGKTWSVDEAHKYTSLGERIERVEFDDSFKNYRPTSTARWFANLTNLTTIEGLENLNTSKVTDMSQMFYGCRSLRSLNLSNFNPSKVTNMSQMFSGCRSLRTILNPNTWQSDHSQYMFDGCTSLIGAVKFDGKKLDVTMANPTTGYFTDPNREYPKAYVLQNEDQHTLTFYYDNNRKLRSGKTWDIDEKSSSSKPVWAGTYDSPNNVVTKVVFDASFKDFRPTTTNSWFSYLKALTTIEGLENLNTSAVTDMSAMFSGCSGLTSLNVSNFNTSAVTNMSQMFTNCSGLKTILNANTWRSDNSINMFAGCTQLKGAVKYDASKLDVTMANPTTGYFTDPNRKLEAYVLQSEDQHTITFYYDNNRKLRSGKTWDIDEKSSSSMPVWAGTYSSPNNVVTKVVFDASFKDFRPTTTSSWFSDLKALTTIEGLENLNTSAVTDMGWMFSGCSGLKELNVSNFNTSAVTNMGGMFFGCSGLKELNVSNFNTSKVTDMRYMFSGCSGLKELNVSNFNTSAVTNMNQMFTNCSGLTSLNVSNFNTSKVTDMRYMFSGCSGLKELNVSNFNTSAVTNMNQMFTDCSGLKTILNPNTWRCEYSRSMFYGCTQLKGAVKYDASKLDVTMANPTTGYFTDPNRKLEAYVLQSEDQHTLTFYYDNNRKLRSGKTWDIDEKSSSSIPVWAGTYASPNDVVTKVVFNASFKDFRPTTTRGWFFNLSALTTIEGLENLNTSSVTNMSLMFSGCSGLKELNVSNFNTSSVTNMSLMFYGCSGLTSLNVSNFNTSSVTNMSHMFYDCSGLTSLNVSNFNTSAVMDMGGMFSGCSGLKELNVSNFNTSAVMDMGSMFSRCSGLKELNVSNFNTSKVTDMRDMFNLCSGLTSLNVSNFNTSKVTYMDYMFYGCSGLTSLNVSNFNTSSVTKMSQMFNGCSSLTELNVSNFNTSKVTDMGWMFSGCSGLKAILNPNTWRCEDSQSMFYGCTQLKGAVKYDASKLDVTMANPTTGYFTDPNREYPKAYVLQSEDQHTITFYYDNNRKLRSGKTWDIDEKSSSSKPVWAGTYSTANKAVTKVVFDASFENFRPTTTEGWFYHLSELTTIEGLENLNTSAVTDMSAMFFRCSGLTSLNLSNFNTSAATNMGWMFEGCSKLTSLNLSNFNTSKVTNMIAMFSRCPGLKELNVSNFNTSAVKNMSWMFCDCSGLKELNISNFNTSSVTNMSQMFFGSSGLTALNLSNFNTSAVAYMYEMFRDCSGLRTIFNTNTWRCEQSQDMFKGCTQLKGAVKYDASKLDVTMANPTTGYFTDPNRKLEAYVLQSEDQHTLTFYYDNNRKLRSGKTWDIDEKSSSSKPVWAGTYDSPNHVVTKVVFDASFKDFRPTTTNSWFSYLKALTTIEGLQNLNTSKVTDMREMFSDCSSLTSLNVSNFNTSKVTNMGWMFMGCSGLKELNVSNFNTSAVTYMYAMFSGCSGLKELNVSNFNTSAVTNMSLMFSGCSGLKELNVSNFNTSAVTDMGQMFSGCSGLKELNVSNFNTSAVTDMGSMFSGCSGLTALNVSNFNTSAVTYMRSMFFGCSGLKELNVSNFNTSAVTDMGWMFSDCSGLKELNVSNFNTSAVTGMYAMFSGCSGLKELNVSNFNTSAVTGMYAMFSGCSGLKELNVSNFNTSAVTNMSQMFTNCSGLKTILNPNTWQCEQSQHMFEGCTQLKGAVKYDASKLDVTMANPTTGYFSQKLPSAIGRVAFDDNNATQIYNLQGKRVNANQRHLPAGFYIVNGKKVYLNEKP